MLDKNMLLNNLIDSCMETWQNPKPFINLGDYYLGISNYTLCYLSYSYAFKLGYKNIAHKLFELEERRQASICIIEKKNYDSSILVSVIMPTFNRHMIISESIASVLSQKEKKIELIIINDGGSDDLLQLLDTIHDPRLRYIKLEKSLGVSVARNHGLEIAVGKYIAYLDDDDIFYPDHITTLIDLIEKTNSDFVYSNCKRTYGEYKNSEFVINCSIIPWQPANFDIKKLLKGNYISTLSVLHKRELIFNIGCFNIDIRYCEDWDLWVRIACSYKIRSTSKITGEYRFRVQSNAEKNTSIRNKNLMNFYDKLLSESYSFLFYYYDLYFYFEKNNKFKESLFYQNRIIELLCGGFYSFNKHQLMIIESVLRKNYPPIPKQKKIVLYAKLIQLKILQNAIYVIKRVNKLYNQNIGWRLKKRKIKYV